MKRRLLLNTVTPLAYQIINIICGFILPRAILTAFGSNVNGLVSSITQFLGLIAFLEMGVGAVIQSSLYKPLAEKNNRSISEVLSSGNKFFKKLAAILLIYVICLVFIYPFINDNSFGWAFTALLIISMSISSFAQYYFGIIDSLLLTADQRGYVQYSLQIITIIVNTAACIFLIRLGASIQVVKFTTSVIFLCRPLVMRVYVNTKYDINRNINYTGEPIKQKWNGLAQHIAAVILGDTDTIVLTLFSSLTNVSIYSVYFIVVSGVKSLFIAMTSGVQAVLGELWAKQDKVALYSFWDNVEFAMHTVVTFVFSCTLALIVPFIRVYTNGITDANYYQPVFASILVMAYAGLCLRTPYFMMILAAGHYKETQKCHIVAAIMNIVVSVVTVKIWGLVGVAIGTLCAMAYQTIWMARYCYQKLVPGKMRRFWGQILVDAVPISIVMIVSYLIHPNVNTFFSWFLMAVEVSIISIIVVLLINFIIFKKKLHNLVRSVLTKAR